MVDGGGALGGDPAAMAALLNPLGQGGWDMGQHFHQNFRHLIDGLQTRANGT